MNIAIIIFWIIMGALIAIVLDILSQLYRVYKEAHAASKKDTTQIYCPYCGINNTSQITKMIIIMQLPGQAVECACFYCNNCSKCWFMELDTFEQKDL